MIESMLLFKAAELALILELLSEMLRMFVLIAVVSFEIAAEFKRISEEFSAMLL